MTNLSDLFPAGAGKQVSFTASGAISAAGKPVILNSAGTVTEVSGSATNIGTKSAAIFSAAGLYGTSAYDINSDRYVIVFQNGSTSYPTAVVAQLTGTTFTFGTPVVWQSAATSYEQAIYDPDQNKVVIFYQTQLGGADWSGTGIVGDVTAGSNSITFGTPVSWITKSNNAWSMAYDTTADRIVGHYYDNGNNNYLYGVVVAISGTTITFGTTVVVRSVAYHSSGGTVYDAYRNKIIYVYAYDSGSNAQYAGIGTVNAGSNSISYTTAQAVGSDAAQIQLTYDPVSYKTVDLYRVDGDNTATKYRVITNSGSSLTFGAETAAFSESATIYLYRQVYDVTNSRIVQPYVDYSNTSPVNYGIVYRTATISGDTVTYSSKTDLGISSDAFGGRAGLSCDQSNAKFVQPFRDNTDSTYPRAVAFTAGATNLTATNFIGIADAAISSAASGNITVKGGIATNLGGATYVVTVANPGSGNRYYIDGVLQQKVDMLEGFTYKFDQSAASNSGHPLRLSTTSNGTHAGGSEYTTGVTTVGTPGSAGAYTQIVVAASAPTLYYYCSVHSLMGGTANTLTGFVANSDYYAQDDGTITTSSAGVKIGRAMSSTALNLEYSS